MGWTIANADGFQAISQHLQRSGASAGAGYFVLAICCVAGVWLTVQWVAHFRAAQAANAHTTHALYLSLCHTHRLNRTERKLLAQATAQLPPESVCTIFVDPRILGRLSMTNSPDVDGYAKLAIRLFGETQG